MLQAGMLTQQESRALLDYPDLEAINNMATASQENFNMLIEEMIGKGKYNPPEPFMNLAMGVQMVQAAYLRAKIKKVPEERLDLLRRFIQESVAMLSTMQMQAMPPAPPPGAMAPEQPAQGAMPERLAPEEVAAEEMAAPIQ